MANFLKTPVYSSRLIAALNCAANWHKNQVRKQGTPYLGHLMTVCALVWENGGDEDAAIAALLHDSIEDVEISAYAIADKFGVKIAKMVVALSLDASLPKAEAQLKYVDAIAQAPDNVVLVSCADSLHNLRGYCSLADIVSAGVKEYYQKLLGVYGDRLGADHAMVYEISGLIEKL